MARIFKVGSNRIVEDDSTVNMTNEQVKAMLKTNYPEVANATIQQREQEGQTIVEFLPQPGRKG